MAMSLVGLCTLWQSACTFVMAAMLVLLFQDFDKHTVVADYDWIVYVHPINSGFISMLDNVSPSTMNSECRPAYWHAL